LQVEENADVAANPVKPINTQNVEVILFVYIYVITAKIIPTIKNLFNHSKVLAN